MPHRYPAALRRQVTELARSGTKVTQLAATFGVSDQAIRAAYKDGLPMKAIAQVMGMSHQRVSQIVRS